MHLNYKINKKLDFVFEYLSDMQKFVSVHPLIYKIDNIGENKYLAYEKLNFSLLTIPISYPFVLKINHEINTISMLATVMKIVRIEINFMLKEVNEQTIIEENIFINSFLPVKFMVQSIFIKQHKLLFKNIEIM
jgi:hypothetical protein